jgi:hypothetical protein
MRDITKARKNQANYLYTSNTGNKEMIFFFIIWAYLGAESL